MRQTVLTILIAFTSAAQSYAAGIIFYTSGGSSYINAVQYETYTAPTAHLSYITVKGGQKTQIQSAGIIANIPLPTTGTEYSLDDIQTNIAQADAMASRQPKYAEAMRKVSQLWNDQIPVAEEREKQRQIAEAAFRKKTEEANKRLAEEAKRKTEADRVAVERQEQERIFKESESQKVVKLEQQSRASEKTAVNGSTYATGNQPSAQAAVQTKAALNRDNQLNTPISDFTLFMLIMEVLQLDNHTPISLFPVFEAVLNRDNMLNTLILLFPRVVSCASINTIPTPKPYPQDTDSRPYEDLGAKEEIRFDPPNVKNNQKAGKIERIVETKVITQKILLEESAEKTATLVKFGVGILIVCAVVWVIVIAILKCFDICAKVRERWRATLPPEECVIEVEVSQTSPRDRKMLVAGIVLLLAGVACLVLPIAWLPTIFWLISPFLFAVGIIIFHMLSSAKHTQSTPRPWCIPRVGWFVILYALLGISAGMASLIILALGANSPQFMRRGLNSTDISEPAIFSLVAQLSDSGVRIPKNTSLTPPESEVVTELSNLLIAKNRLWIITRMKTEKDVSASDFSKTLSQAVDRLFFWFKTCSEIYERHQIQSSESINKIGAIGRQMADESSIRTEGGCQRCIPVLIKADQMFGSDAAVQKAIQAYQSVVSPNSILSDMADKARLLLATLTDLNSSWKSINDARSALEVSIASIDASSDLDPILKSFLKRILDRRISLGPTESNLPGPYGTTIKVINNDGNERDSVIKVASIVASMLAVCPEAMLLRHKAPYQKMGDKE